MKELIKMIKSLMIKMIRGYQRFISPMLPNVCRFRPTCSEYFIEALQIHGIFKGSLLGIKRILRCHPWGGSGFDPVPEKNKKH